MPRSPSEWNLPQRQKSPLLELMHSLCRPACGLQPLPVAGSETLENLISPLHHPSIWMRPSWKRCVVKRAQTCPHSPAQGCPSLRRPAPAQTTARSLRFRLSRWRTVMLWGKLPVLRSWRHRTAFTTPWMECISPHSLRHCYWKQVQAPAGSRKSAQTYIFEASGAVGLMATTCRSTPQSSTSLCVTDLICTSAA